MNYDTTKEYDSMDSKDISRKVFDWLWHNDQRQCESHDDSGAYPSKESIAKALLSLKLIKDMED
jgi:hypothetical protein